MRRQGTAARDGHGRRSSGRRKRERTLRLKPEERELLRLACRHYRNIIPAYLAGRQEELRILDALLRVLD